MTNHECDQNERERHSDETPLQLKIVIENPMTKQAMLKHGISKDPMFGWGIYGTD